MRLQTKTPHFRVTVTRFLPVALSDNQPRITKPSIQFTKVNARLATGDRHPVVYVSSLDAMKFCQWA